MLNLIKTEYGPPLQEQLGHIAFPGSHLSRPIRIMHRASSLVFS
jgi:hypothetical protein